ncbi:hypothetical protein [Cupriavidus taiwanensis]|uniref:hypothetical protein n=1 Tax=Cupriavidus taiwanensis TaxID=164546 RepID=UPI000E100F7E|nr:hypothetical protein [Cupriavidus taiwanensis]SOY63176.1 conserved hypothetical protein [Cupriavidus taiwanensis]SOY63440.1 conserved hypothetical protein [Cupriavidus taiwanensis]SOY98443.1 conserved hypothetical protein [Cupriavidus taiwanensis]SOZ77303.1 conserved hypothetical protein [Cupriavidus taiwanensis]SOZ85304.1 conserved hypothetical protein [Cupriavidus taiwanensis]
MPIQTLDPQVTARARLNALRFNCSVAEAAQLLAKWQVSQGSLLVPIPVAMPKAEEEASRGAGFFRERAKLVRAEIAKALGLEGEAASKLSFTMTGKDAWYLGPRPKLDAPSMLAAVAAQPAKFIELMLLKELIESAAFEEDTFVRGGFGPSVYLGSVSQASKKYLQLAEAEFEVNMKHGLLLCDVKSKRFARKASADAETAAVTRLATAGEGYLVAVTRTVPGDFFEVDARKNPMEGLSLDREKIRRTRMYYLNVLTEFAARLFTRAGIPFACETFVATHYVDDAYIPLEPLANLQRPLAVVNTTMEAMDHDAIAPLARFPEYLPDYHVAGNKKTHFPAPDVRVADGVPVQLDGSLNYLFLNGEGDEESGSIRLAKGGPGSDKQPVRPEVAYTALAKGEGRADPYTEAKFHNLLARATLQVSTQGLDCGPRALAALRPGKATDSDARQLQEALKRCLVELSLKEVLLGKKPILVPSLPDAVPRQLTLLATRRIKKPGRQAPEQMVAAVDVTVDGSAVLVTRTRRTPWGKPSALLEFVAEFPFLQESGKSWIRDGQFWVIDVRTGDRLTVWAGTFVPKIILNETYPGIEAAIAAQDDHQAALKKEGGKGRLLSKSRDFNLLPYYISMFRPEHSKHGERIGLKMPVQDCGSWVRLFVPPEGGINGSGDALSGMRDVMHYGADGAVSKAGLLDLPLVQLYLHTMTNGVLVGGDNSKMSVLEKLVRLALEN